MRRRAILGNVRTRRVRASRGHASGGETGGSAPCASYAMHKDAKPPLDLPGCGPGSAPARGGCAAAAGGARAGPRRHRGARGGRAAAPDAPGRVRRGPPGPTPAMARLMAAVLACGEGRGPEPPQRRRAVGDRQAGGVRRASRRPARGRRTAPGSWSHRSRLRPASARSLDAIPVTTPGRTLVDLADVLSRREPRAGHRRGRVPPPRLHRVRAPSRGAAAPARSPQVLAEHQAGSTRTRSELEEAFLAMCEAPASPDPR